MTATGDKPALTPLSNDNWPDLAGRLVEAGRGHILPVRVYFEDTDFSGLVYHASYIRWCERGRSDFLRLKGINHHELAERSETREPAAFVVRRLEVDYLRPAKIDDLLEVVTRLGEVTPAWVFLEQQVQRGATVLMRAKVQVVLVGRSGRPLRVGPMMEKVFG